MRKADEREAERCLARRRDNNETKQDTNFTLGSWYELLYTMNPSSSGGTLNWSLSIDFYFFSGADNP